jgi:hypothetical protein
MGIVAISFSPKSSIGNHAFGFFNDHETIAKSFKECVESKSDE